MLWDARRSRRRDYGYGYRYSSDRAPVFYWPLALPLVLAGVLTVLLLFALLQVGIFSYALGKLGIDSTQAMLVLLASLAGSAVNIPVARLRSNVVQMRHLVTVFGMRYVVRAGRPVGIPDRA